MLKKDPIKEMERRNRVITDAKIDFDTWWMMRVDEFNVPAYLKEVVRADFKGRKMSKLEFPEDWDIAAEKFGLKRNS